MCSAATANSTMDFSAKPLVDGVVDSPPSKTLRQTKSCSPSPLKPASVLFSQLLPSIIDRVPQRKLYVEPEVGVTVSKKDVMVSDELQKDENLPQYGASPSTIP